MRTVAGASLLSAAATLPLHMLPVLVLALSASGTLEPAYAGWVGSAYMLGQLTTVVLLPACSVTRVRWSAALGCVISVLLAAYASAHASAATMLAAWLVIGIMAGVLQYLASVTAARAANRKAAFGVRMAASSITGALLMAWLQLSNARVADYAAVCTQFALAFCALTSVGLLLYRSDAAMPPVTAVGPAAAAHPPSNSILGGLVVLFALFVGQQGLWSLVMQSASAREIALGPVVWMICASKLLGAAAVLLGNIRQAKVPTATDLAVSGAIVALGGLCMGITASTVLYVAGLVLWEVALNVLSARFQALLACTNPRTAGMWITANMFLGAACGHALAPYSAASGQLASFIAFAVASALLPSAWARVSRMRDPAVLDVADA